MYSLNISMGVSVESVSVKAVFSKSRVNKHIFSLPQTVNTNHNP